MIIVGLRGGLGKSCVELHCGTNMQQKKRTRPQNSSIMEFETTPTQFQPQSCQYNEIN